MQVEKFLSFTNAYFLPSSLSEKERGVNEVKYKTKKVLEIFPNSVSIREYERTYIERDKLKVITLARLTYQKNPEMFLEVVKKVKEMAREINIEFIIIGGGYAGELEEMIMQKIEVFNLKKDIIIMPWLTADKVDEMLNDADIYLSTSRYEGLPTVLLLAMEKQIPIIATNVDGNKDVIFDTINGFLCENVTEIAEKIILLAKNKEIRKQMGCKAREILKQKFDIKENIRLLERLYGRYALQDGNYVIQ
jgi:glycosyltransferase involved in cell wall biosynthesis